MLDALAFLPVADVRDGMRALKEVAPEGLSGLADYFDVNYVSGTYRTVTMNDGSLRLRRTEPRFNPETWNVHEATMTDQQRTNNMCESWNNGFNNGYCSGSHLSKLFLLRVSCCMALWPPDYNLAVHLALCILLVLSKLAL